MIPDHHVERIGRHEVLGEICHDAVGPGRDRRGDGRVSQIDDDQSLEMSDELMHAIRRQIQTEHLDRDQTIAVGIEATKDRTERTRADLMQDAERSERVGGCGACGFRMQWERSSGRRTHPSTSMRFDE